MSRAKKTLTDPEFRRSEIKKYQDTMMADMGISSLDELYSDEERKRWLKALMPSENVQKKLIDMGYSLHKDDNIMSLGGNDDSPDSRLEKIANLYKLSISDSHNSGRRS